MKLIKRQVKKLEAQFAGDAFAVAAAGQDLSITWTRDESPSGGLQPGPGERVVEDLILDDVGEHGPRRGSTIARITADELDLGVVYNAQHRRIGRVTARKGGARIIEWE